MSDIDDVEGKQAEVHGREGATGGGQEHQEGVKERETGGERG